MRILLINDFYVQGGAEAQVEDLFRLLLQRGYEVRTISFDPNFPHGELSRGRFNYRRSSSLAGKFFNKFFVNLRARRFLKKQFTEFRPDVIHLHNAIKMTKTLNGFLRKRAVIQTFHDFGYVCPEGTCVKADGSECCGFFAGKCRGCTQSGLHSLVKRRELVRNRKYILKTVRVGLSPSVSLCEKMKANGYTMKLTAFPNLLRISKDNDFSFREKEGFLYCGVISREKGIVALLHAFGRLEREGSPCRLTMIGGVDAGFQKEFRALLAGLGNVEYLGKLPREEIGAHYRSCKFLIVPSLWLENYPNVMAEAISQNTLCIGSGRGGIAEILKDRSLLFDPRSEEEIAAAVTKADAMGESEYTSKLLAVKARLGQYHDEDSVLKKYSEVIADAATAD